MYVSTIYLSYLSYLFYLSIYLIYFSIYFFIYLSIYLSIQLMSLFVYVCLYVCHLGMPFLIYLLIQVLICFVLTHSFSWLRVLSRKKKKIAPGLQLLRGEQAVAVGVQRFEGLAQRLAMGGSPCLVAGGGGCFCVFDFFLLFLLLFWG